MKMALFRSQDFPRSLQLSKFCRSNSRLVLLMVLILLVLLLRLSFRLVVSSSTPTFREIFAEQRNQVYSFKRRSTAATRSLIQSRSNFGSPEWNSEVARVVKLNTLSRGNMVMVALVNYASREMLMNWIASLEMNGYHRWVVLCVDFQLYSFLVEHGYADNAVVVPRQWVHKDITALESQYKQPGFVDLMQAKVLIIIELLKLDVHLFYLDVDIVFCSPHVVDHIVFDDLYVNTDFLYMVDVHEMERVNYISKYKLLELTFRVLRLELTCLLLIDGGFWLARPTNRMIEFFKEVFEMVTERGVLLEQDAMNMALANASRIHGKQLGRPLDKLLYPSGWVFWQEDLNAKLGVKPLVVHMNWIVSNAAKKAKLKEAGLWFVGENFAK